MDARKSYVCGLSALVILVGGCKVFVPDSAFVNGGRKVAPPPQWIEPANSLYPVSTIPLEPTETTLAWASRGGSQLDRLAGSNPAIVYYGHKEAPKKEKPARPQKAPLLVLTKTVKNGGQECDTILFDKPPPPRLLYRLRITNIGSGDYQGRLELTDKLPDNVTYVGIKEVRDRKITYVPYIGPVETKHDVDGWQVEPTSGGKGTRVRWWANGVKLKKQHWITVDIEFEPPPFGG